MATERASRTTSKRTTETLLSTVAAKDVGRQGSKERLGGEVGDIGTRQNLVPIHTQANQEGPATAGREEQAADFDSYPDAN